MKVESISIEKDKVLAVFSIDGELYNIEQQFKEVDFYQLSVFFKNAHQEALRMEANIHPLNHKGIVMYKQEDKIQPK